MTVRTLHPVWRCERCNYWEPRNGQPDPGCPYCSQPVGKPFVFKPLTEAMRLPPEVPRST